jgi:hypothetical protein
MNGNTVQINIVHKTDHDFDPKIILHPGYKVFDIMMTNMLLQPAESVTAGFISSAPATRGTIDSVLLLDNLTELVKVDDTDSAFPELEDDGKPVLMQLQKLLLEAWTIVRSVVHNETWPDIEKYHVGGSACATAGGYPGKTEWDTWDAGKGMQIFFIGFEAYKAGLMYENYPNWGQDLEGAVTSAAPAVRDDAHDLVGGLLWYDSDDNHHYSWYCRIMYGLGLAMRNDFPDLTSRIESTTSQTMLFRNIESMYFLAIVALNDLFPLSAMQSDVAVFNLAGLYETNRNRNIPEDIYKAADNDWLPFVVPDKYATFAVANKWQTYTGDFINTSVIEATTIDNAIHNWKTQYLVCGWSLKMARSMWGLGTYSKRGNTIHFANLFNGIIPTADGLYNTHGVSSWALGINISIGIDYLKARQTLPQDFLRFVNKKNFTWTQVNEIYSKFFTPFSVLGSLNGYCEPEVYIASRRGVLFEDFVDTTSFFRNESVSNVGTAAEYYQSNTDTIVADLSTTLYYGGEWIWLYTHQYIPEDYYLLMPYQWDDKEIYYSFLFGILFDTIYDPSGVTIDADFDKVKHSHARFVECIDAKQPEKVSCLITSTVVDQPKIEDVKDVLATGSLDTTMKYGMELVNRQATGASIQVGHRPNQWKGASTTYIENIGNRDVALGLIANSFMYSTSGAQVKEPAKPDNIKPPDQNTDEAEEDVQ